MADEKKKVEDVNGVVVTPKQPNDTERETETTEATETPQAESDAGTGNSDGEKPLDGRVSLPLDTPPDQTGTGTGTEAPEPPAGNAGEGGTTPPEGAETPEPTPPEGTGGGSAIDVTPTTEAQDKVGEQPVLTEEEIAEAKKKDRRQKRMNTAARIMDALSRVSNYVATTQGAPSAKWSNRIREYDENNTYLTRLKDRNAQERKDWWNRYGTAAGIDNAKNTFNLNLQNAKAENERKNSKEQRERELHQGNLEAQGLANEKARLSNEGQELANRLAEIGVQYAPQEKKAGIAHTNAQTNAANASAEHTREQTRQLRENGGGSGSGSGSGSGKSSKTHTFLGEVYDNQNDYEAAVRRYKTAFPEIDIMLRSQVKGQEANGKLKGQQEVMLKPMSVDQMAALFERHAWEHSNYDDAFNFGGWSDKRATTPMRQTTRNNDAP